MPNINMIHFKPDEFKGWYDSMSPALLIKLDFMREVLGEGITLTDLVGGYGRYGGESYSQHNIDRWGEVRAVDGYIPDDVTFLEFYEAAKKARFTGIGFYTGWDSGRRGFHVDVREGRIPEQPAQWTAQWIDGKNKYNEVSFIELLHSEQQ